GSSPENIILTLMRATRPQKKNSKNSTRLMPCSATPRSARSMIVEGPHSISSEASKGSEELEMEVLLISAIFLVTSLERAPKACPTPHGDRTFLWEWNSHLRRPLEE